MRNELKRSHLIYQHLGRFLNRADAEWRYHDEVVETIRSFAARTHGWHFGKGVPASEITVNRALVLYRLAAVRGLVPEPFLGDLGDITLVFARGERSLEVVLHPAGSMALSLEHGFGFDFDVLASEPKATLSRFVDLLNHLTAPIRCGLSDSSSESTFLVRRADSSVSPFASPATEEQSPSYTRTASSNKVLLESAAT